MLNNKKLYLFIRNNFSIITIWFVWLIVILNIFNYELDENLYENLSGQIESVECVSSRSINVISIDYISKKNIKENVLIPLNYKNQCDIGNFDKSIGAMLSFIKYKTAILEARIDEKVILEKEEQESKILNKMYVYCFFTFVAFLSTILILMKR